MAETFCFCILGLKGFQHSIFTKEESLQTKGLRYRRGFQQEGFLDDIPGLAGGFSSKST